VDHGQLHRGHWWRDGVVGLGIAETEAMMPPKSEAQRRLMHAAAKKKGGAGGVSQKVGKEFSDADKPGKLPERKKSKKHKGRK